MKHDIHTLILTGLIAIFVASSGLCAKEELIWKSFKPVKAPTPVNALVMGKQLVYYPLEAGSDITISVQGPNTVRVLTRIEFGNQTGGEKSYYLRYEGEDGKKKKVRRVATNSTQVVLADDQNNRLGNSRSVFIKVPEGNHTYRFYVGDKAAYQLFLRFYLRTTVTISDSGTVAYAPAKYTTAVPLIINEKEMNYYRVGQQDSLKLSVIGPARVTVLSRLEFDTTMLTEQRFRIRVLEDNQEKRTYSLKSWSSVTAEYRDKSTKVAGKAAKFFIEVPRGKHEYRFQIPDDGRTVLMRFYLPRKDLNNNL